MHQRSDFGIERQANRRSRPRPAAFRCVNGGTLMDQIASFLPRHMFAPAGERLSCDELLSRVWVFASPHGVLARQVRLLPDGRISGHYHPNEHSWAFRSGRLAFLDVANRITTSFDSITRDADDRISMAGVFARDPGVTLSLAETVAYQALAPDAAGFPIDIRVSGAIPGARRRNLVIVFGNERSLHREWPRNLADADRSWDLCVSFYGDAEHYHEVGPAEFSSLQTSVRKCPAAHAAFGRGSPLWNYERVWLADDDLMIDWAEINALFSIAENFGLAISQPSLRYGSKVAHDITRQQHGDVLRTTSFVEAMAPVMTHDALQLCMPVFDRQILGWGTDHVWPKLIGPPQGRLAVIDAVSMLHTREPASSYSAEAAFAEQAALLDAYGLVPEVREYGRF